MSYFGGNEFMALKMQILEIITRYKQIIVVYFYLLYSMSRSPYEFKSYQFKTTAPYQFTSPPKQTNGATPTFSYEMPTKYQPTQQYVQPAPKSRIQTLPDSFPTIQPKVQFNISDMKNRLDMLLKQTDSIQTRRGNNFTKNQSTTNVHSNYYTQRRNGLDKAYQTNRDDKFKNYDKYQKISESGKQDRNGFGVSYNSNSSAYELKSTNKPNISQTSYKNSNPNIPQTSYKTVSIQKPVQNRESYSYSTENFYSNKNSQNEPSSIRQYERFSEPIQINQSRKPQSVFTGKIENPEKLNNHITQAENEAKRLNSKKPQSAFVSYGQQKSPPTKNDAYRQTNGDSPSISYNFSYGSTSEMKNNYGELSPFAATKSQKIEEGGLKSQLSEANLNKLVNTYQLEAKIKKLQIQNNKLKESVQSITESKEYYRNQLSNEWKKIKEVQDQYEAKIAGINKNNSVILQQYEQQKQKIKVEYEEKIISIKQESQKEADLLKQEIDNKQKKIIKLVKEIGDQSTLSALEIQSNSQTQNKDHQMIQQKLEQKQYQIAQLKNQINARDQNIQMLNQTLLQFKSQMQELKKFKQEMESQKYSNFDQILITQMQTINQLKEKIEELYQKSNDLRERLVESERKNQSLISQYKISELKHKSEINNMKLEMGILESSKDNMIGTLNKKMLTLEEKYKLAVNEIKTKDQFFKQHLVGRADSTEQKQYIESVLTKYRQSFSETKEEQLIAELEKANKKLQLYEKYA